MNNLECSQMMRAMARVSEIISQMPLEEMVGYLDYVLEHSGEATEEAQQGVEALGRMKRQAEALLTVKFIRLENRAALPEALNADNAIAASRWLGELLKG